MLGGNSVRGGKRKAESGGRGAESQYGLRRRTFSMRRAAMERKHSLAIWQLAITSVALASFGRSIAFHYRTHNSISCIIPSYDFSCHAS